MFRPSALSPEIYIETGLLETELRASPLAINGMKLLYYARDHGGIPLTKTSAAFQRKCVEWAADEFQWPGYEPDVLYSVNKVLDEIDFPPLTLLHWAFQDEGLIRHLKGKAVLTKKGQAMLGQYGQLQAAMAERLLEKPYGAFLPPELFPVLWDLKHMIDVIANRLWGSVKLGEFTEWVVPLDVFAEPGPLGVRFEASLYIASNLVRPMSWLGLLEEVESTTQGTGMEDRLIRKTAIFERFFKIVAIGQATSQSVH